MQYCIDNIEDKDILIQNDKRSNDNDEELCTGFMFIKSNERTKNLFNQKKLTKNFIMININYSRDRFTYKKLPLNYFLMEDTISKSIINIIKIKSVWILFLIHFNHIKGRQKIHAMRSSKWLVSR